MTFERPQPGWRSDLKTIPQKLRGTYQTQDTTQLIVDQDRVIYTRYIDSATNSIDTLFCIPCGDKIRRFKRVYYLNRSLGESSWTLSSLTPVRGGIEFTDMTTKEDLKTLQKLTNTGDSVRHFDPTDDQMKDFLKSEFSFRVRLTKVKKKK